MFAYINNGYVQYILTDEEHKGYDIDFRNHCVECGDDTSAGMKYDPSTGEFSHECIVYTPSSAETADNDGNSISNLEIAIAELAEKQEHDKVEIETALAELAETLM